MAVKSSSSIQSNINKRKKLAIKYLETKRSKLFKKAQVQEKHETQKDKIKRLIYYKQYNKSRNVTENLE